MYKQAEFISKKQAEKTFRPELAHRRVLISITSPNKDGSSSHADLDECSWFDILRLEFHDAEPMKTDKYRVYFDERMARQVIEFLADFERSRIIDTVIVHCDAGISRSAAVVKFISQIYNLPFPESYRVYNKHVFTTLLKAYGQIPQNASESAFNDLPEDFNHE